ncbi:deleted in malignant brain tumors 1 protein-like isoform X2 [Haliotis rubra]|uniref:deleted in malignant brain tumors 1 protein-like isoform X2 n=1 Tax=Haliotis rubra TaxID=36100 RepID=UPI001EE5BD35|nr:deleted in malignant brain tumors 1 protein-like isoform X2 [Haliotis rubra]
MNIPCFVGVCLLVFGHLVSDNTNTIKFHQICGETRRNVITRNDQHFHVVFKTDSSTTARGFLIRYYETEGVSSCGRSLVATSAGKTFTSPGYPNTYLTTQSCTWTITTEHQNQTLVLDTEDSELESISAVGTCDSDNVTVYDGRYSSDVLGTFCGDQQPVFTSGGNLMRVHLQTNHENNFKGFKIRYKAVDAARCVLTIPAGESPMQLVSPGYPQGYQSGLDCHWIIYAPTGSFITVKVIVLDMETVPLCSNDYLLFKDGSLTSIAPTLARICNVISFPIKSARNHMAILFHSDNSTTGRGFRLQYFAGSACGKSNISASTMDKYLSSPGYPSLYSKKLNCKWTVSAPTGYKIEVYIMDLYMDQYCWTDYLLLKDGPSSQDALLGRYCGSLSTRDAVSSSNYITIVFNTNGSVRGIKFRLKYKAVIPTAERVCGNRLNAEVSMTNYLTSPGYPGNYGNNVSCTWTISTTNGNKIKVEIMSLSLQLSEGCTRDYLLFVDNSSSSASPLAKYCDTFLKNVVSSSNYMIITFHTDESVTRGFSLKYTATRGCGEHHMLGSSETTLIQSPNYPFYYPQNADCEWTVSTDVDAYVIHVKVKYFDLEFSLKCSL